jgi:hypothetical protein
MQNVQPKTSLLANWKAALAKGQLSSKPQPEEIPGSEGRIPSTLNEFFDPKFDPQTFEHLCKLCPLPTGHGGKIPTIASDRKYREHVGKSQFGFIESELYKLHEFAGQAWLPYFAILQAISSGEEGEVLESFLTIALDFHRTYIDGLNHHIANLRRRVTLQSLIGHRPSDELVHTPGDGSCLLAATHIEKYLKHDGDFYKLTKRKQGNKPKPQYRQKHEVRGRSKSRDPKPREDSRSESKSKKN